MLQLCPKHEESHQSLQHTAKNLKEYIIPGPRQAIGVIILLVAQRRNTGNNSVKPLSCQKKTASVNEDEHMQGLAAISY
jgi:hypothetical protein